jgi:hypothetical protein
MAAQKRYRMEWFAGAIVFIAFIGAHLLINASAAVKVAGGACVITGILWMFRRAVPLGVEGRAPSAYLGGWAAFLAGLAMVIIGGGLLAYSGLAACVLGWASAGEC